MEVTAAVATPSTIGEPCLDLWPCWILEYMKIIVAPDSFKECLDAGEVASAISEGIFSVSPDAEVRLVPLSDGRRDD